jgi:hypothetical protein
MTTCVRQGRTAKLYAKTCGESVTKIHVHAPLTYFGARRGFQA